MRKRTVYTHAHGPANFSLLPHTPRPPPAGLTANPEAAAVAPPAGDPFCHPCLPSQARGRGSLGVHQAEEDPVSQLSHWQSNRRRQKSKEEVGRAWTGPLTLRGQAGSHWEALQCLQSAGDSGEESTHRGPFAVLWGGRNDALPMHQCEPEGTQAWRG